MSCAGCGRLLTPDERGLSRKLINRGTTVFYCLACLSGMYKVPEDSLREMIERFRAAGCTLFPPKMNDNHH